MFSEFSEQEKETNQRTNDIMIRIHYPLEIRALSQQNAPFIPPTSSGHQRVLSRGVKVLFGMTAPVADSNERETLLTGRLRPVALKRRWVSEQDGPHRFHRHVVRAARVNAGIAGFQTVSFTNNQINFASQQ